MIGLDELSIKSGVGHRISLSVLGHKAMDLISRSFCIFGSAYEKLLVIFNIHGLLFRRLGLPMFSDMNTQKLFTRYSFSYLTNWQPGRYHLNNVAPLILWFMDRGAVVLG